MYRMIERTKMETEIQLTEMFNEKEVNLFNRYDNEKQELWDKIKELE